jgi:glycosyltransferase involved in cell wall biosynthesis
MGMSNRDVRLRFMGVYEAQFRGLQQAGAQVRFTEGNPDDDCDVIVTTADAADIVAAFEKTTRNMVLYVPPADQWFDIELLRRIKPRLLFAYGTWESQTFANKYAEMGIEYWQIPFGADAELMRPLGLPRMFDVCFIGGVQHRKGWQPYIEPLVKRIPRERLLLVGAGYERYGIGAQAVGYGPLVNVLYNLSRVCVNFHSTEQKRGGGLQWDLNNRVFDLAMAGCVQVCDNTVAGQQHFTPAEIVFADDPAEWAARIFELLARPEPELDDMRAAARKRAEADHTWRKRGETMLALLSRV